MDKPMPNFMFKIMTAFLKFRDVFRPRERVFSEVDIKPGYKILDFGCGPGSYSILSAKKVGDTGKVYALDIHPLAIQKVQEKAKLNGLKNIETICSNRETDIPDKSLDMVLLYDIFHMLGQPDKVLTEIHRVLKDNGILSFSDHHMKHEAIMSKMASIGLFKLQKKGEWYYSFDKF